MRQAYFNYSAPCPGFECGKYGHLKHRNPLLSNHVGNGSYSAIHVLR